MRGRPGWPRRPRSRHRYLLAAAAIERAREKAARRGLEARFVVGSVLDLTGPGGQRAAAHAWLATITRT